MKIPASIALALLLCFQGQAATIYFDIADFQLAQSSFRALTMTPLTTPSLGGTNQVIVNTPRRQVLNQYGRATFTNVVAGTYRVLWEGNPGVKDSTTWQITVTNTSDTINGALISSVETNSPTLTSAYSIAASDARFVRSLYTNGVLVGHSPYISVMPGTNVFIGATNAGGSNFLYISSTATGSGQGGSATNALISANENQFTTNDYHLVFKSGALITNTIIRHLTNEGSATLNYLTVSQPVFTDSNKRLVSSQIDLANENIVTGVLPDAAVATSIERKAHLSGSNYVNFSILNGSNYVNRTELNGSNYTTRAQIAGSNFVSTSISDQFDAVSEKTAPVGTDLILIEDSAASNAKKFIQIELMESALENVIDIPQLQGQATTAQIADDAITYAKIQNIADTQRVLGRNSSGAGNTEEVTISQFLDWLGSAAQGDIIFRSASGWDNLAAGTSGQFLQTLGAGANPIWAATGSGGNQTPWTSNIDGDGFGLDELGYLLRTTTNLSGTLPDLVIQGPQIARYFPTNTWMINIVKPSAANKGASFTIHITNTNDPPYSGIVSNAWAAAGNELIIVGTTNSIIKGEWDGTNVTIASWHARNVISNMTVASTWNGVTGYGASMDVLHDYFALGDPDLDGFHSVLDSAVTAGAVRVDTLYSTNAARLNGVTNAGLERIEGALTVIGATALAAATATSPSANDNDTSVATTEFVQGEINNITNWMEFCLSDEATALTTGNSKVTWRAPFALTILYLRASVSTNSSSGVVTFDINKSGSTILSTKLTIDASEKTSVTAATPYVLSSTTFADDEEITFDQDSAGTGATGAKVKIYYTRP